MFPRPAARRGSASLDRLLLVIEGTVNVALAVSEINTGPAVWRPVTDRPADVVEVGLPFTADQARRAGVSLD